MKKTITVPPDGGYGWVIVFASALNNFFMIPLIQNFGMIFKDTFAELGLSAAQGSLIINLNSAFGMLTGLINGPLLNYFGYRKISIAGAALISGGVFLTAFAKSFTGFLITYGLIGYNHRFKNSARQYALGLGVTMSSFSLAINTYFEKRKSKAIGLSIALSGLGPIFMPQLINILLQNYTIQGVTLILSGICANGFVAASLLQPVRYHMKKVEIEDVERELSNIEEEQDEEGEVSELPPNKFPLIRSYSQVERGSNSKYNRQNSEISINYDQEGAAIYGIDSALGGSVISLDAILPKRSSIPNRSCTKTRWWNSEASVNLNSSYNLFDEKPKKCVSENQNSIKPVLPLSETNVYNELSVQKAPEKPRWKRILMRIIIIFDLTLLKDPVYLNIMLGMSLAVFAELNFSVLTVFILNDFGLSTGEIATFLSFLGIADITMRFLAPYIGDFLRQTPRVTYLLTLLGLIVTRFLLLIFNQYKYLLGVATALGAAKGVRSVYMSLVIPTYVPLNRLAAASGIQMMVNGFFIIVGGPLLGAVRDLTGSYKYCIIIMNCVTFTTVAMWTTEFIVKRYKNKKDSNQKEEAQQQEN